MDPTSPAYSPSIFGYVRSPKKRQARQNLLRHKRIVANKRRRIEAFDRKEQEEREKSEAEMREREECETEERERCGAEAREREQTEAEETAAASLLALSSSESQVSHSTSTELTLHEIAEMEVTSAANISMLKCVMEENTHLKKENAWLVEDNARLMEESTKVYTHCSVLSKAMITQEALMDNDVKVKYYTGLPSYKFLKAIFDSSLS